MRFLIDQNLSVKVADSLVAAGHDAVHVSRIGAASASDAELVDLAKDQDRVIISADTNFGALLAGSRALKPSVLLVREILDQKPVALAQTIMDHLEVLEADLKAGAMVAFRTKAIRVRMLPLR